MEASLALTALNFLVSLVKPLLCGLSTALGVFGMTASQAANVPLAVVTACAHYELGKIREFVEKAETELAEADDEEEAKKKKKDDELAVASPKEVELTVGA